MTKMNWERVRREDMAKALERTQDEPPVITAGSTPPRPTPAPVGRGRTSFEQYADAVRERQRRDAKKGDKPR